MHFGVLITQYVSDQLAPTATVFSFYYCYYLFKNMVINLAKWKDVPSISLSEFYFKKACVFFRKLQFVTENITSW